MTYGHIAGLAVGLVAMAALFVTQGKTMQTQAHILTSSPKRDDKVVKTDEEWKKILTEDQYKILRHGATEAPFCTIFHDNHKEGSYYCAGCKLELFSATSKFDSGTGWPSFFKPVAGDVVWRRTDTNFGMVRDEVLCARCDGHLGHVFDDGPKPTGLRYCINGKALLFKEKGSDTFEAP